jgi:hypothetical protein
MPGCGLALRCQGCKPSVSGCLRYACISLLLFDRCVASVLRPGRVMLHAQERINSSRTIFGYVERVCDFRQGPEPQGASLIPAPKPVRSMPATFSACDAAEDRYVRFDVIDPRERGDNHARASELARTVRIRQHDRPPFHRRPVVKMWICLGHLMQRGRGKSHAPHRLSSIRMLIGRSAMRGSQSLSIPI